jgi:hypothetical protein
MKSLPPADSSKGAVCLSKQGRIKLSLDVLTALAEEADALQPIRRMALFRIFIHASHSVFAILGKLIAGLRA